MLNVDGNMLTQSEDNSRKILLAGLPAILESFHLTNSRIYGDIARLLLDLAHNGEVSELRLQSPHIIKQMRYGR